MSLFDPFKKYFVEPDPHAEAIGDASSIIEFSRMAYYQTLIAYLERGADEPLAIGSETSMVASAARVNTYKEIKKHLQSQVRSAEAVLERERSDG